jgi:asparagine synthase (glutamine-hydrolysing)
LRCKGGDIAASFPAVIRHTERPVVRAAPAALFLLSRQVRDHGFKVVLTGEGADEVFGGYDIFKEAMVRRFWARAPRSKWRPALLRRLYPYLGSLQSQPSHYLEAFFRTGLEAAGDPLFSHLPRFALTRRISQFYSADLRNAINGFDALEELRASLPAEFDRWHPLSRAQYLETRCLLPGYILSSQGDRVAMAHAVEGRFPFLDHRVVELGAALPPALKLRGLREKYVLRRALGRHLPREIVERPKQPYRAPDSESFLQGKTLQYVEALLAPETIARAGYFEPRAVRRLVEKCRNPLGRVSAGDNMAFMGILSTQLLHSAFVQALI